MLRKISFLKIVLYLLISFFAVPPSAYTQEKNGEHEAIDSFDLPKKTKQKEPTLKRTMQTHEIGLNLLTGLSMPQTDPDGVPYFIDKVKLLSGFLLSYNFFVYHNVSLRLEGGFVPIKTYEIPQFIVSASARYYTQWFFLGLGGGYNYVSYKDPEVVGNKLIPYFSLFVDIGYTFPLDFGNLDVTFRYTKNVTNFIVFYGKQFSLHTINIIVGYNFVI